MKTFNHTPLQFHTNDGIGLRLANAAAHKKRFHAPVDTSRIIPPPSLSGYVLEDTVSLGTEALLLHVNQLMVARPIEVLLEDTSQTRIRVCGAFDYVIDHAKQQVWSEPAPLTSHERRSKERPPWGHPFSGRLDMIDLLNPLCRPAWLVHVAARPAWFGYAFARHESGQDQLFMDQSDTVFALSRVTRMVCDRLRHDAALIALQHALSTAITLHIGPSLVNLAMRARVHTNNISLNARHLNLVWRHQSAFTSMERENPHLLPLLTAWLMHDKANDRMKLSDALPAIRREVLDSGLSPKAWRYLVQHGMKRLLPSQTDLSPWKALIKTLLALNAARWPAPPPRGFLRLLHDAVGHPEDYEIASANGVPGWFWQMACAEAFERKNHAADYLDFFDRVPQLAWLVRELQLMPDHNQRRKGIAWLYVVAQANQTLTPSDEKPAWALWLQSANWDEVKGLTIVPLLSRVALLKEAITLHNCADTYTDACQAETRVLLSLRNLQTDKRVALACLVRRGSAWILGEVAGPCNKPVPPWVRKAAEQAAGVVRLNHSQRSDI